MNLSWVLRRALLDCNVVRQNNTTPAIITEQEMVSWAQDAVRMLEALWRKSKEDQNLVTRVSSDSAFTFDGETYDPDVFTLLTTTLDYVLPPDLIQIKQIRATTEQFKHYIYTPRDISDPVFRNLNQQWNLGTTNPTGSELYYDLVGRRTLHFSHAMPATTDIELIYLARLPKVFTYVSPSTFNMTNASASVTDTTGTLLASGLTLPANLVLASDGGTTAPSIVTQTANAVVVLPGGELEYPIESFDTATTLTLEAVFPGATDTAVAGMISSAPWMFEAHGHMVMRYVRHMIYSKLGNDKASANQFAIWMDGLKKFEYDIVGRSQGTVFVQDWEG